MLALILTVATIVLSGQDGAPSQSGRYSSLAPDTMKVLIVFVKFADDRTPGDPAVRYREWPLYTDPTQLPASAPFLISSSPDAPFVDSTLTAYMYAQSNGQLVMFGDVHPRTIVTSEPEVRYHRPAGGYGDLTYDVIAQMDDDGVDFSEYDYDDDGIADQIFMIVRRDSEKDAGRIPWTGASCLDARCANGPPTGRRLDPIKIDGITIDWNLSGSIVFNRTPGNIDAHYWLVRMMAHEYGHDLWRPYFVHIPALTDNDVPANSNYSRPTNTLGYVLMAGAGGGNDARGDETISAFERDLLGWIDCPEIQDTVIGVTVRDLYTSGDCVRIPTGGTGPPRMLYVSNRQRIGAFDRYRRAGNRGQFEIGLLRTTGLLIGMASRNRYDVIPADNSLQLSVVNSAYDGDLFRPGQQLTPWTRPNINGYTRNSSGVVPSWHAIDNIRRSQEDSRILIFDYLEDFRVSPVFRVDSWLDSATDGQRLLDRPRVAEGTLNVDTSISISGRMVVEGGAALRIGSTGKLILESGSSLVLFGGSTLQIDGALQVEGLLLPHAQSKIELGETARLIHASGK